MPQSTFYNPKTKENYNWYPVKVGNRNMMRKITVVRTTLPDGKIGFRLNGWYALPYMECLAEELIRQYGSDYWDMTIQ